MAEYRLDHIRGLAAQMGFTPLDALGQQLQSAERLLTDIDPAKAYPLDFIIFRITDYRPKKVASDLLTGIALQHDLGLLIEQLSERILQRADDSADPVLSIDDVTERFNVSSKTIQRWRRRGLPARMFVFADGKKRVGFFLSSVERFFAANREQVPTARNLSLIESAERDFILRRAWMLARDGGCWESEMARRIARKLNRSPATVLHTIRRHDEQNPDNGVLRWAPIPVPQDDRSRILRAYRHGASIKSLARKYHQSRASIYRVIIDERIARLCKRKITFIDDDLYQQPDAGDAVKAIVSQQEIRPEVSSEELRVPRDLPAYLQELYRTPLLTPSAERALFLKFNFHKHQFIQARRELEPQFARSRHLDRLEQHLHDATQTKNAIVAANLRLVVSVARKHLRAGLNLMELISDGNITLMRAVEGFDLHKGNRFSTYATLALMKGFARSVPQMQARSRNHTYSDERLLEIADSRMHEVSQRLVQRDELRQLMSRLNDREREVLLEHYGLGNSRIAVSHEEMGEKLGLSPQRIRQIERRALAKLRQRHA
jgi:RNA polymerase sigma factor (sigma-70 family)